MSGKTTPSRSDRRSARDLLDQAQDLIYDAWEIDDASHRVALARKALKLSPDCADAYVLLAEAAITPAKALEFYRQGVEAGERALGKDAFDEQRRSFLGNPRNPSLHARPRRPGPMPLGSREHDEALELARPAEAQSQRQPGHPLCPRRPPARTRP